MKPENTYVPYPNNLIAEIRGESPDEAKYEEFTVDQRRGLYYALCALEEHEKNMLLLKYKFGKSTEEISKLYEISAEDVESILRENVEKLSFYRWIIEDGLEGLIEHLVEKRVSKIRFEEYVKGYRRGLYGVDEIARASKMGLDIDVANFTVRTQNCLRRAGINTISDLLKYKDKESIESIRNLSRRCIVEVAQFLFREGCSNEAWEEYLV